MKARPSHPLIALLGSLLLAVLPSPAAAGPSPEAGRETAFMASGAAGPRASTEETLFAEIPTVISASRYEQGLDEAPASITIITAEEIRMFGYRTLAELLKYTRGFYVSDDRNYQYAGSRGFSRPSDYNNRILLMVNGHSTNEKWTGGSYIGNEFGIDLDLVDRIEIVRGPASALYGSNAVFAVINVITRGPEDMPGLNLKVGGGSFQTGMAGLFYGRALEGGDGLVLGGSGLAYGGQELFFPEFDDPATNSGVADEEADEELFADLFGSLRAGNWTFEGKTNRRRKAIPTASFGTEFNDPDTFTVDGRAYLEARHQGITAGGAETSARVYYDRVVYYGDYIYDTPPLVVNRDEGGGDWIGAEYQVTKRLSPSHRLSAGAQYDYNFNIFQKNFDENPFALYLDQEFSFFNYSVYVQDEINAGPKLRFHAGARFDKWETFGDSVSPRAAVIYSPRRSTTIKALFGSAFRAPTIYELFYEDGGLSSKENPDLVPEEIETLELVWEQRLSRRFSMVASVYDYRMQNLISQFLDPADGLFQYRNLDRVRAYGMELEVFGRTPRGVFLRAAYAGQRAEDEATGLRLTNSPEHTLQASVAFPILGRRSSLAVQTRYMSERLTFNRNLTDEVYVTDLTFNSGSLWDLFDVSVGVRNLLDHEYGDPGGAEHAQDEIPQDGRTFFMLLRHRF
ncbi:MAG: TonB-dependent receptor plug domain-containing protein [Acidobacteriota bacterium]